MMKLTEQSKELVSFFQPKKGTHKTIKKQTEQCLKFIYDLLVDSERFCHQHVVYAIRSKYIQNKSQIVKPKHFHENSFPKQVIDHIHRHAKYELCYSFSLLERQIQVFFILEKDTSSELNMYNKYIRIITIWLYILNVFSPRKCANCLSVYFYMTQLKKQLPESSVHILNEMNVNTAFTTSCPVDAEIIVYRKEEWLKVFIHETMHNFGLDFSMMTDKTADQCILNLFTVGSKVNSYEAYAEFWAEVMNVCFCAYYHEDRYNNNKRVLPFKTFLNHFEYYIEFERMYSVFQMVKILDYMKLSYQKMIQKEDVNLYKEHTNVLSYYVIKTILLYHYSDFVIWCNNNNTSLLNFKKTKQNLNNYCTFIQGHYKQTSLLHDIERTEAFYAKLKNKKKGRESDPKFVVSNLRMSIWELG